MQVDEGEAIALRAKLGAKAEAIAELELRIKGLDAEVATSNQTTETTCAELATVRAELEAAEAKSTAASNAASKLKAQVQYIFLKTINV